MRALVVREFGGPESVVVIDVPIPEPGPGEVRVRVAAAGVNFADVMVRAGMLVQGGSTLQREQYGLGADVAGTVDAVGEGVSVFAEGDEVIGLQERLDLALGTQADYVVLNDWALSPAPVGVSLTDAAMMPLPATTADQSLDALGLVPGQWLLVTGAAGVVGGFAVELAVLRGLRVIAQATPEDETLVKSFGAELFVARDAPLAETVRALVPGGADGALDAANVGTAADDAVRHGGAFVSLLNSAPPSRREVRTQNVSWHTDGARLVKLAALAGVGRLSLRVAQTYPFEDAAQAHADMAKGGIRGRLVLVA